MILSPASNDGLSLVLIEGGLTAIATAMAFCWPRLASKYFSRAERVLGRLARRRGLTVAVVGAAALVLRLAILPIVPIPKPFVPNDFSFLLAADTFASGRLTNPTPTMWTHFENLQITMEPTYMSAYFPAQGMVLAAGKILFGHAWYGVLLSSALMCAAICWMLQAWLPPAWAFLGGVLAVLRLGLFSYWINSYFGGALAALGGALVLGALPRFMRAARLRESLLMAIGVILLATSRPYEGILLCLPVAAVLGRWIFFGNNRPSNALLLRRIAAPLALILFAGAWMAYYNYRVFGNPFTPPYAVNRATYARVPYYVWQPLRAEPVYRHKAMRDFYYETEFVHFQKIHTLSGFVPQTLLKAVGGVSFFSGIVLLPLLIMLRRVLIDRRTRFLVLCVLILIAGMLLEIFLIPHYLAPFTAAFYALGLQAMRHLRLWQPGGQPVGATLVRFIVTLCFVLGAMRLYAGPLALKFVEWPPSHWTYEWYGPGPFGIERAQVEAGLEGLQGRQLAIVRYTSGHNPMDEWVYNAADLDNAKVVWAWEMNSAENLELVHHYKDRKVWLVQPDQNPVRVSPYPLDAMSLAALSCAEEPCNKEVSR